MSARNLSDMLSRVTPECPQCPYPQQEQALLDTIRDFCQATRLHTYEAENETVMALVSDYDIELPDTTVEAIAIEYMSLDGTEVKARDTAWLDKMIPDWRKRSADDFRYFTQLTKYSFTFPCVPITNQTVGGLYYRVQIKPKQDATSVDGDLADEWIEAFSDGAKAKLLAVPDKPWTQLKRAEHLDHLYRSARGRAKIRASKSRTNATQRWSNPRGFA